MDSKKKELLKRLIVEARQFRFCGPSDDVDEQAAATVGYHYLVVQFKNLAGPILPENLSSRLKSIEVDFESIYTAYAAHAEIDSLLPDIESALERPDVAPGPKPSLSALFVNHAADVLAATSEGLTGAEIVRALGAYAIDFNVEIPHTASPFDAPNKRTALSQNLMAFSEPQRYQIIRDLCDHPTSKLRNADASRKLKLTMMTRYGHLDTEKLGAEVNEDLINQTRHWLGAVSRSSGTFQSSPSKICDKKFCTKSLGRSATCSRNAGSNFGRKHENTGEPTPCRWHFRKATRRLPGTHKYVFEVDRLLLQISKHLCEARRRCYRRRSRVRHRDHRSFHEAPRSIGGKRRYLTSTEFGRAGRTAWYRQTR